MALLFDDNEDQTTPESYFGGLLADKPRSKNWRPDLGMLGLAAGLLEPTPNGRMGQAFSNGLTGWAGGIAAQRRLDEADAENDPNEIMRKYAMQAQAKARAAQMYGNTDPLHGINTGKEYLMVNPRTGETVKSYPLTASQNSNNVLAAKGLRLNDNNEIEPIPGWQSSMGQNKLAENAPLENFKTSNNIFAHQQNNSADVSKERDLGPIRGDQEYSKKTGEDAAKRYNSILEEGMNAQGDLTNYGKLDTILSDYEGGKLSGIRQSLGEFANSLGIKDVDPKLDEKQLFHSIVGEAALKRLKQMGGNDSNQDREFVMNMGPSLTQTAEGRKQIVNFYKGIANQRVLRSQMAQKWVQSYGRIDATNPNGQTFDQRWTDWVNRNPVSESLR